MVEGGVHGGGRGTWWREGHIVEGGAHGEGGVHGGSRLLELLLVLKIKDGCFVMFL